VIEKYEVLAKCLNCGAHCRLVVPKGKSPEDAQCFHCECFTLEGDKIDTSKIPIVQAVYEETPKIGLQK